MDVVAALVADTQPPVLVQPGDRALDYPPLSSRARSRARSSAKRSSPGSGGGVARRGPGASGRRGRRKGGAAGVAGGHDGRGQAESHQRAGSAA